MAEKSGKSKKSQNERLEKLTMKKLNLKTSRAYHLKLNFQELFTQPADLAEPFFRKVGHTQSIGAYQKGSQNN